MEEDTLLEVGPGVEAAVEEAEDPVGVAPEVVAAGEKADALLEVAPGVEAVEEEGEDPEAEGEVVVVQVGDGPGVEPGRHGNRSSPFQTPGMHGEGLLGLFGVCQHNEWSVEKTGAPPAKQVLVRQRQQGRLELGLRGMSQGLEVPLGIEEEARDQSQQDGSRLKLGFGWNPQEEEEQEEGEEENGWIPGGGCWGWRTRGDTVSELGLEEGGQGLRLEKPGDIADGSQCGLHYFVLF